MVSAVMSFVIFFFTSPRTHIIWKIPAIFVLVLLQSHLLLMYSFLSCGEELSLTAFMFVVPPNSAPTSPFD